MLTHVHYRDIERTEALENFLLERTEDIISNYIKNENFTNILVKVETIRHRTHTRKPVYNCEIIIKPTHQKRVIKVNKNDENFYACVAKATRALEGQLRKRSDMFANHGRRFRKHALAA